MTTSRILVFDLGNVLYAITSDRDWLDNHIHPLLGTTPSWEELSPDFDAFEVGAISEQELMGRLASAASRPFTAGDFREAWNRRLVSMAPETVHMLQQLSEAYPVYLLSNTNETHVRFFLDEIERQFGAGLFERVFRHCFYSCEMGVKKPDPAIYQSVEQHIAEEHNGHILFFDDNRDNVKTANNLGWQAFLVEEPITDLVARIGLL